VTATLNSYSTDLVNKLGVSSRELVIAGNLLWRWNSAAGVLGNHHTQNGPREILLQLLQQRIT